MSSANIGLVAAFGGGLVSFLSPCVLPLVPGYLSLVTGLELSEITENRRRHLGRIVRDTSLFIAGFSAVFIGLGLTATTVGRGLGRHQAVLTRISGLLVLAMGLFLLGSLVLQAPGLYGEKRFRPNFSRFGIFAAPVAGAAFGFGWTPCIGPVLGSVLAVAATDGHAARGASLLASYSLGLGVPFLATGLALGRLSTALGWLRRHGRILTAVSGVALSLIGTLLAFNRLTVVTSQLQTLLRHVGLDRLLFLG